MKRCRICRLDYPFNHTVCPADGTWLEEVQRSSAVAPVIEIQRSPPPASGSEEEGRRGGWTLPDDFREFLEDIRLRKSHLELGARPRTSLAAFPFNGVDGVVVRRRGRDGGRAVGNID